MEHQPVNELKGVGVGIKESRDRVERGEPDPCGLAGRRFAVLTRAGSVPATP
jgi:hypothetical protein